MGFDATNTVILQSLEADGMQFNTKSVDLTHHAGQDVQLTYSMRSLRQKATVSRCSIVGCSVAIVVLVDSVTGVFFLKKRM